MQDWVAAGQTVEAFERATLREMQAVFRGAALRDARLAWSIAQYSRFAFHSPNEMPDEPGKRPDRSAGGPADVAAVRAWMIAKANGGRDGS